MQNIYNWNIQVKCVKNKNKKKGLKMWEMEM